jgi:DNA repair protein RadD
MQLRPYQQEAVEAVYRYLREHDVNPCVVIPTAGGKTPVMASICKDAVGLWQGRVLIVAHVKELLEQAVDKIRQVAPELLLQVGVYSAGLKSRDTDHPIIVAGVQSIYKRALDLGRFDLVIIDEAHMIPADGDGMYRTLLADMKTVNPRLRVIGLTATPFRMATGTICEPDNILNEICYEIGVRELIAQCYLCPLKSKSGKSKVDTSGLHIRGGEFIPLEVENLMDDAALVRSACNEIIEHTQDRRAVLIFASGVNHAMHVQQTLTGLGHECGLVTGDTLSLERAETLNKFRSGCLKHLVNVNVLTTGFDAPNIDCVALLRPTMSPGLYYQMVGRGFRLCESKTDCLVLDFGGNIMRHGPVDALRIKPQENGSGDAPAKECPECNAVIHAAYTKCPDCGYEFPPPERNKHEAKASEAGILSGQVTVTDYEVQEATYSIHHKRNGSPKVDNIEAAFTARPTMRVDYRIGFRRWQSEWVCFEHTGYARAKAEVWWRQRSSVSVPSTVEEAVDLANAGALCETTKITVRHVTGEKYDRIINCELGEKPDYREPGWDEVEPSNITEAIAEDVPF